MFDKAMRDALRADAEKLRHLTGEQHEAEFWDTCQACQGEGGTEEHRPQYDDPDFCVTIKGGC